MPNVPTTPPQLLTGIDFTFVKLRPQPQPLSFPQESIQILVGFNTVRGRERFGGWSEVEPLDRIIKGNRPIRGLLLGLGASNPLMCQGWFHPLPPSHLTPWREYHTRPLYSLGPPHQPHLSGQSIYYPLGWTWSELFPPFELYKEICWQSFKMS
jgi:hypothetical protein